MLRSLRSKLLALSSILGVAACGGAPSDADPGEAPVGTFQAIAAPVQIAYEAPVGLIASTGNLYFTSYAIDEFGGPSFTSVWRTSKGSTPGQETTLARAPIDNSGQSYFGAITFANVGGAWLGFFVSNVASGGVQTSRIESVSLAGGAPRVLATSPAPIGVRDLVTDGRSLFWADAGGLRAMPIGGGAIQTLKASTTIAHLALDATNVYFGEYADIGRTDVVKRVPKGGGNVQWLYPAQTYQHVSAIHVDAASATVFWGESGGAVKSATTMGYGGGPVTSYFGSAGRSVSAVGFDGSRVLWIDCAEPGNTSCAVRESRGGVVTTIVDGRVGAGHLQWDAGNVYWGDVSGVWRAPD